MKRILLVIMLGSLLAFGVYAELDPAVEYCIGMGYEWDVEETHLGESGICIFPDGNFAPDWDFLMGRKGREYSYCAVNGLEMRVLEDDHLCNAISSNECMACVVDGVETEVTRLMNLSFEEAVCGDGVCTILEDPELCQKDCPLKEDDDVCKGEECLVCEDPESCEDEALEGEPFCIDNDGVCFADCVGTDLDCEDLNASAGGDDMWKSEPADKEYAEAEISCEYDGLCHPDCMDTDIDCLCIDSQSDLCEKAVEGFVAQNHPPIIKPENGTAVVILDAPHVGGEVKTKSFSWIIIVAVALAGLLVLVLSLFFVVRMKRKRTQ
jgi:putative hemolysin